MKNIQITYCVEWNYFPKASGLAAAIKEEFGVVAFFKEGSGGILEVKIGDDIVYTNKSAIGDLPPKEIIKKMKEYLTKL